jgi:hypothetical protein
MMNDTPQPLWKVLSFLYNRIPGTDFHWVIMRPM